VVNTCDACCVPPEAVAYLWKIQQTSQRLQHPSIAISPKPSWKGRVWIAALPVVAALSSSWSPTFSCAGTTASCWRATTQPGVKKGEGKALELGRGCWITAPPPGTSCSGGGRCCSLHPGSFLALIPLHWQESHVTVQYGTDLFFFKFPYWGKKKDVAPQKMSTSHFITRGKIFSSHFALCSRLPSSLWEPSVSSGTTWARVIAIRSSLCWAKRCCF